MFSEKTLVDTSKYLSFVLRHQPESAGLALDREGWVAIEPLLAAAATQGKCISHELLLAVVASNDKKRFTLSEDGLCIRAAQGHSATQVAISHVPVMPPAVLYHGTATRFLKSIRAQGLLPGSRQHVHLSAHMDTAISVGLRHGMPVVLTVDAATMQAHGHEFYQADNGVWLTAQVPAEFLGE